MSLSTSPKVPKLCVCWVSPTLHCSIERLIVVVSAVFTSEPQLARA
jgi:hypothetical protein